MNASWVAVLTTHSSLKWGSVDSHPNASIPAQLVLHSWSPIDCLSISCAAGASSIPLITAAAGTSPAISSSCM
jgi:hypothetical protein